MSLLDMEGKTLSSTLSYNRKTLASLVVGAELRIGQREVEVGDALPAEQFESGAVFLNESAHSAAAASAPVVRKPALAIAKKKFKSHRYVTITSTILFLT